MTDRNAPLSRRSFLARTGALAALGAGAPTLLTACGSGGSDPGVEADPPPVVDASTCRGYRPDSESVRVSLGYVDASEVPGQYCENCRFYSTPEAAGARCGGCELIPENGPVSPGGYCRSWAAMV